MLAARRRLVVGSVVGAVLAIAAAVGVIMAFDREPAVDGEFVLDQPGIYSEPITTSEVAGRGLPFAELVDAAGTKRTVASFVGRPLVINLWYSTCAPCARELRDFAAVDAEFGDRVQFLGIDPQDEVESMTAFADARGVTYPLLLDADQVFATQLGTVAYPTTLFVSSEGVILHQTNEIDAAGLRSMIAEHFGIT